MKHLTAPELASWIADAARPTPLLLDVREVREHQIGVIDGAVLMPMHSIPAQLDQLDQDAPIVCICHHGARSMQVAAFLEQHGYADVTNLSGGMHAWSLQVDPSVPTY